jgi:hypothetical protein
MKIDYILTDIPIGVLADATIFHNPTHNIEYQRNPEGYLINTSVFIPISKISYVVFKESDDESTTA